MTMTTTVIRRIEHDEATGHAREAYRRFAELVGSLAPADFAADTPCAGWTVRHVAAHMVGAMRSAASLREQASQQLEIVRRSRRTGVNMVDTMTQVQIERTASLSDAELAAELARLVEPAAEGRRRTPGPVRRLVQIPVDDGTVKERWRLGYLVDVILTRDAWMHRIDVSRALGREVELTAAHDGRLVNDLVGDWAERHRQPFELELTGPAGGVFRRGTPTAAQRLSSDPVSFALAVSGRAPGQGLLATRVPF